MQLKTTGKPSNPERERTDQSRVVLILVRGRLYVRKGFERETAAAQTHHVLLLLLHRRLAAILRRV